MSIGIGLGLHLGRGGAVVFDPRALGSVHGWWAARFLTATNGDRIASLPDQSGNGRTFAQATSGKQPAYETAIIGGLPALRFASSRVDGMATSTFTAVPEPATVAIVAKLPASTPAATQYLVEGNAVGRRGIFETSGRLLGMIATSSGPTSAAQTNGTPVVVVAQFNGTSSLIRVNGVQTAATSGTATSPTGYNLGQSTGAISSFDGWIAEAIEFNDGLSASEMVQLERSLGAFYGITIA